MSIVGAGNPGLEMGRVYKSRGTDVTVVEFTNRTTPTIALELSQQM